MRKSLPVLVVSLLLSAFAYAACPPVPCVGGTQTSGAQYRICVPAPGCWNGSLVVYAHGYVEPDAPIVIPESQLAVNGVSLPVLVNQLGYAFAVSSYSTNGLAIRQGVADSADLVNIFDAKYGTPKRTYIAGASEGGLVATLSAEQLPAVYNAALPTCGPIGDFQMQVNYVGDFRVIFDYFYPGVLPASPVSIPTEVMTDWDSVYVPAIQSALLANPGARTQLIKVTQFPVGPDATTTNNAMIDLLWYDVFATNDAITKLGGQPYDNHLRIYAGSSNDTMLNANVQRFTADSAALTEIAAHYQTTGKLLRPAVTMHTLADPIIPYLHETLYTFKTLSQGTVLKRTVLPVLSYGHCNFSAADLLTSFGLMVLKDAGQKLAPAAVTALPPDQQQSFSEQAGKLGILSH